MKNTSRILGLIFLGLTTAVLFSCQIFGFDEDPEQIGTGQVETAAPTETMVPSPTPTVAVIPQAPALIEVSPNPGVELPLNSGLTLYFNQPMDQESVENSVRFTSHEVGEFRWENDTTVSIFPAANFLPSESIELLVKGEIKSANGLAFDEDKALSFETVDELKAVDMIPLTGSEMVDPSSAVLVSFNRPAAALGEEQTTAPAPFTLIPQPEGRGEWVNTSTYIFYPDPLLAGDTAYEVVLNPGLAAADLAPLTEVPDWTFTTSAPRVLEVQPEGVSSLPLEPEIRAVFNHPMDQASVENAWNFGGLIGSFEWNDDSTEVIFTPNEQLPRSTAFTLTLSTSMKNAAGSPLSAAFVRQFVTVPDFIITGTNPASGQFKEKYSSVKVSVSSILGDEDITEYIQITPELEIYSYGYSGQSEFFINGNFDYSTQYTVRILGTLPDAYGQQLGSDFSFNFFTPAAEPELNLNIWYGNGVLFTQPESPSIGVQSLNINHMDVKVQSLNYAEFNYLFNQALYEEKDTYTGTQVAFWREFIGNEKNRYQIIEVPMMPDDQDLATGIYLYDITSQEAAQAGDYQDYPFFVISSYVHLTYKFGPTELMVWAVDTRTNQPVAGESVHIYDSDGTVIAQGLTDVDGVFYTQIDERENYYENTAVLMGSPGEDNFSLAISNWSHGLEGWEFGLPTTRTGRRTMSYFYTDRPIYRPGQTVNFKAVVRELFDGQYTQIDAAQLPVSIGVEYGDKIADQVLDLSEFGTAEGTFIIPEDLEPGVYRINSDLEKDYGGVSFIVANYRKPEFEVLVNWPADEILSGAETAGEIMAQYYFGAPTSSTDVEWFLYERSHYFYLPGYQTGPLNSGISHFYYVPEFSPLGDSIDSGVGTTGADGMLPVDFALEADGSPVRLTLEATVMDESGFPVSGREEIVVHPGDYYIGARTEGWIGESGEPLGFEILTVDWDRNPTGDKTLTAEFARVKWVAGDPDRWGFSNYEKELTLEASTDFSTGANGKARLEFIPQDPGTYQLTVSDGEIITEVMVWVSGRGDSFWSNREENQIDLQLNQEAYSPGETAEVFIPNPFEQGAVALVTVERSTFFRREVLELGEGGAFFALPLTSAEAPNVFVSATILGENDFGSFDMRQGYAMIEVNPSAQTLTVEIASEPSILEPGSELTLGIRVIDDSGAPVQGEFSVSLVDKAVLALAEPNSEKIQTAFYDIQPLGITTSAAQIASTEKFVPDEGGLGGGGGGLDFNAVLRDNFEDTAFWKADVITDVNGMAELVIPMPDNLTTWHVLVRGLSADTRVGESEVELISTKPLLIRPITPRFFIEGDHLEIAGVVHNNTSEDLTLTAGLNSSGFELDDTDMKDQEFQLASGERARVSWWGTVMEVDAVDFTFSISGGEWSDHTIPEVGSIPVYAYISPKIYGTSGMLMESGQVLELVSVPKSITAVGGALQVSVQTSLTGILNESLAALLDAPDYETIEQKVSRILSGVVLMEMDSDFDEPTAEILTQIDNLLLYLEENQQKSGGWGWSKDGKVSTYISAYVLYALSRFEELGVNVSSGMMNSAVDYLSSTLPAVNMLSETWQYDRLAFLLYVLSENGSSKLGLNASLFNLRDDLSPWGKAFLSLAIWNYDETDAQVGTLISDLMGEAVFSAGGVHWDAGEGQRWNMDSGVFNNSAVVFALSQISPDSNLLDDAVRYLMLIRESSSMWTSSYDTAWVILASSEYAAVSSDWEASFAYSVSLNAEEIISGSAVSGSVSSLLEEIPLFNLNFDLPNALEISKEEGEGRLYYSAYMQVKSPVEEAAPLANGVFIEREYIAFGEDCAEQACESRTGGTASDLIKVRLSITLPHDLHHVVVEDFFPAGAEAVDPGLLTSQLGLEKEYSDSTPFEWGWFWWVFDSPDFYDHKVSWTAEYLQAGSYELTYILRLTQPGEFQVMPARIWQMYFPDIQAAAAGEIFTIISGQ